MEASAGLWRDRCTWAQSGARPQGTGNTNQDRITLSTTFAKKTSPMMTPETLGVKQ